MCISNKLIKKIIFIFLYCFTIALYSQDKYNFIVYNTQISNGFTTEFSRSYLIFDSNQKVFFSFFQNKNVDRNYSFEELKKKEKFSDINVLISYSKEGDYYERKFHFLEKNIYITRDQFLLKWSFSPEEKIILGIICKKATTTFRGRTWTVWYNTEIPVGFGPWKLDGLPGIILEAYDDKNFFKFSAEKIVLNDDSKLFIQINTFNDHKQTVLPYRRYIEKENKLILEFNNKIYSNLPQGSIIDSYENIRNLYLEKSFEWEETK